MKVKTVRTFLVDPGAHKHWLFVKVETDDGLYGWGECYTQVAGAVHQDDPPRRRRGLSGRQEGR